MSVNLRIKYNYLKIICIPIYKFNTNSFPTYKVAYRKAYFSQYCNEWDGDKEVNNLPGSYYGENNLSAKY